MQELKDHFASQREQLVEITTQLIRRVTVNPPGNEKAAADYVASLLDGWGIPWKTFEAEPDRTNLIAYVGSGKPRLLVACHLDTVAAGDGWDSEPFQAFLTDGRIYGRGSCDNKGQMASMLLTLKYLKEHEAELTGQFILACVADEEAGSALGLEFLLREGHVSAEYAIIPDAATMMQSIIVAEKGPLFLEIVSHGKQAHGSTPHKGVNAVWNMIELLGRLRDVQLPGYHELLGIPTMNLGVINGGVAPNVVPAQCSARFDVRFVEKDSHCRILDVISAAMRQVENEVPGARFELKVLIVQQPIEVGAESELVRTLQDRTESYLGFRPRLEGIGGSTVAKMCVTRGIPAVNFACGDGEQAHVANEYIEVEQLTDFAGLMAVVAKDIIGKK